MPSSTMLRVRENYFRQRRVRRPRFSESSGDIISVKIMQNDICRRTFRAMIAPLMLNHCAKTFSTIVFKMKSASSRTAASTSVNVKHVFCSWELFCYHQLSVTHNLDEFDNSDI